MSRLDSILRIRIEGLDLIPDTLEPGECAVRRIYADDVCRAIHRGDFELLLFGQLILNASKLTLNHSALDCGLFHVEENCIDSCFIIQNRPHSLGRHVDAV